MKRLALLAAVAGLALVSTQASARYGVSNYYGFTSSYIGSFSTANGTAYSTQPTFLGNPRQIGFSSFFPTLSGSVVNIPIPAGRHSAHWWRVFTTFEVKQVASLLSSAGAAVNGGKGVPGPIAGAGLPLLAVAGAFMFLRRRRDTLAVA